RSAGKPQPSACLNCSRPDQPTTVLQRPLEFAEPLTGLRRIHEGEMVGRSTGRDRREKDKIQSTLV
ncbi:hypothetical protein ACFRMN_37340, partial [Streptomyces sp. NPDC056835]|uniref:hypothetical protein n=1 Tax=Streptomyces sp. NPDC056835 TaxID=3345956 RepID=UPI0036A12782